MAEEHFTVTYTGPALVGGRMSVRDFAQVLIALTDAVGEAHHLTMPGEPDPSLAIEALREGSFSIDLILSDGGLLDQTLDLLSGRESTAAANLTALVAVLFGGFKLTARLARRLIDRQDRLGNGNVRVTFDDETTITLPVQAVELVSNQTFRQSARQVVLPVGQEGIDEVRLEHPQELVRVTIEDLPGFEGPARVEELLDHNRRLVGLRPVTVAFTEGNKWRVSDGETTFFATVQDEAFVQRVQTGEESFAFSDTLRADLRTERWRTADGSLRVEHYLERVVEHIRGPAQIPSTLEIQDAPTNLDTQLDDVAPLDDLDDPATPLDDPATPLKVVP